MDIREKNLEGRHLSRTVSEIKKTRKDLETRLSNIGRENLTKLHDLRSDPESGTDFEMLLDQLHEKNEAFNLKDKFAQLEELQYLANNPFFARTDLLEHGKSKPEKIYIGKFGFTSTKTAVTDWRSPIASIYYKYRYPQKDVRFNTVTGTHERDLTLKRTFDIYKSKLVKYYNNDIQLDESNIVAEKISKRTGGILEDIVETIQKDQMEIIEADPREICIVQGCVGSGKSTVAIHKLAHIFFNFPGFIHSSRSILVAKNQILVSYLSTLFPKLGIFDINYKTLRDLVVNVVFREEMPISIDLDATTDPSNFSADKIKGVYATIVSLHAMYAGKIAEIFSDPSLEGFGGYKYSDNLTPYENLNEIFLDLNEEVDFQNEELKENPNSIRAVVHKENIKNLRRAIRKINDLKYNLKHTALKEMAVSSNVDTSTKIGYLQTLFYVFIYSKVIGFSKFQPYEYCVVDEAQDFSPLEYAVLGQFVLRNRFGLFGDLNQQMSDSGITDWEDIKFLLPRARKTNVYKLTTNYRSTKQIIDYANKILSPYVTEYLPNSINRKGAVPVELHYKNTQMLVDDLNSKIRKDLADLDKSVAVISYDENLLENIGGENKVIRLSPSKSIDYSPKAVYLMGVNNCKGLEFSKVYVVGQNVLKINNAAQARKLFVAVTRAMNELIIMQYE